MSFFRTRKQNEDYARREIETQIRRLERQQTDNTIDIAVADKRLSMLTNVSADDIRVQQHLRTRQQKKTDQQRIMKSLSSLQDKLTSLSSAGTTLAELNILPTYSAATKVSTRSVLNAQDIMKKIQNSSRNQESLEGVILTEVDTDETVEQWKSELERKQAEEIDAQLMEQHNIRTNSNVRA